MASRQLSRTMTVPQFRLWCRRAGDNLLKERDSGMKAGLDDVFKSARALSSGTVTARMLARMGHPFGRGAARHRARRSGHALSTTVINRQSARFFYSWRKKGPRRFRGRSDAWVHNEAPYARYLDEGTRFMVSRPITRAVRNNVRPRWERRMAAGIVRSFEDA